MQLDVLTCVTKDPKGQLIIVISDTRPKKQTLDTNLGNTLSKNGIWVCEDVDSFKVSV
jgi:hypothetical protein